ncbi:MAG: 3-dehydroquinate synthase [Dehalococcoidia bacterium]|nr:3-dehydroquinate synthase [Dehalococcoidia bacterium]
MAKVKYQSSNIILTGFSGTGKSLVAKEIAQRLNWDFVDTDVEIVKLAGKPISEIFQWDGESKFRGLERQVIEKACQQKRLVVAIGGGAIINLRNYELLTKSGFIFCLEAKPETIYQRLFQNGTYDSRAEVRPLLTVENPLESIRRLKASRQSYYANVDWTIHTDTLNISQVAKEVIKGWKLLCSVCNDTDKDVACWVRTATQDYPVFVGCGLLNKLGEKVEELGSSGRVAIISDETVFSVYGHRTEEVLREVGLIANSFVVPSGEENKTIDSAIKIYDFLVEKQIERGDILIALGGGMVGDLAGFVAATFLRGISWVQVPTSLVAMVDASIGGKVGVNHSLGKNLIGTFYQPSFVLADCGTLTSLPQRELTSGWAEVIKYGLIMDEGFLGFLETNVNKLTELELATVHQAIVRSAIIKSQIVSEDEKEVGKRIILNYGHTIAHGLEAASQYRQFLHGEAVAIGMMGAAKLSQKLELLSVKSVEWQQSLLQRFGLAVSFAGLDLVDIIEAMKLDKKVKAKDIRWVLLQNIGSATIRSNVPQQDVLSVLQELLDS